MSPNDVDNETAASEKTVPQQEAVKKSTALCQISSLIALCALWLAIATIATIFFPDFVHGRSSRNEPATKMVWLTEMMNKPAETEISIGKWMAVRTLTTLSSKDTPTDVSMEVVCRAGTGSFDCNPFAVVASPNMEAKIRVHVRCQVSAPREATSLEIRCGGYDAKISAFEYQKDPQAPLVEIVIPPDTIIQMGVSNLKDPSHPHEETVHAPDYR